MEAEYDFVVVGGGPSGLQFAREVASRSDYSVVVLERNDDLQANDKSTGGTFQEVVADYDVPDEALMAEADSVTFESPSNRSRHNMTSYVLDFPRFLAFLGDDAAAAGADVRTGTHVTGPIREAGRVCGVRYRDADGDGEVRGRITVDASGPSAALTSNLGFVDRDAAYRAVGLEFEAEGEYETDDTMLFRFDHDRAPGGYAWTFPAGETAFKAGVCWMAECPERREDDVPIHAYVERWVDEDPRWTVERVRAKHAGEAIWTDSTYRRATDGFLAVGDSVSSINPLFGEGIRPGMESASMAADVALDALDAGDCSRRRLREYERRWTDETARKWKLQRAIGELLYHFDADQQDEFVERVDRLSPSEAERLRTYSLSYLDLARLCPFKLNDVPRLPRLVRYLW